jgi:hypothetical protein
MASRHKTEKSSTCPKQPHSREVEHPAIDSKNTFEVPFDFISSQSFERYPPEIPIQPSLDPSYTSSPEIPKQDSSSNKELQKNLCTLFLKLKLINSVVILEHISSLLVKFL